MPTSEIVDQRTSRIIQTKRDVLVIIFGNHRGGAATWQTFFDEFFDPQTMDLATFQTSNGSKTLLHEHSDFMWLMDEYDDWGEYFDAASGGTSWRQWIRDNNLFGGIVERRVTNSSRKIAGSGAIGMAYRYEIKRKLLLFGLLDKYKHFVVMRSDLWFRCPIKQPLFGEGSTNIWIPDGQDYGGLNDRFLAAPHDLILKALSLVDPLLDRENTPTPEKLAAMQKLNNFESFVRARFAQQRILRHVARFNTTSFIVKRPVDPTSWGKATETLVSGTADVFVKKADEYRRARATCDPPPSPGRFDSNTTYLPAAE